MSAVRPGLVTAIGFLLAAGAQVPASAGQAPAADLPGARAAVVNGAPIMAADVDAKLGNSLAQLQEQIFTLRKNQLDAMIDQKLLDDEAARRGVTTAALVETEITSRVTPVTAEEARKFYDENKARLPADFGKLEDQIKSFLASQRVRARQQEYLQSLRASAKIDVLLAAPPIFRSEVVTAGAPVRGAADAPVTIVEFSDFHCPFCRKIQPVLEQVRAKYGSRIKLVFRDFPLDSLHPQARVAAEAGRCANEQGKFWEFHDKVFAGDPDASQAALDRIAKEAGMDVTAFETCRTSGKYRSVVQASSEEGTKLGITGTPTFFVNGRILVGAQPFEAFVKMIDEELAASPTPAVRN
jgi:protein-disulfide isomerase